MNSFELNKIIAAIIVTVLIVLGIGKISNVIYHKDSDVVAYKVEAPEGSAVQASTESSIDISAFLAMGDVDTGEKQFKKCKACHSINKDGRNNIGPKLWNVMFRPVGSITEYKYSKALSSYKKDWSWEEMNGFLLKPAKWIKGNKMGFAGIKDEKERASVILYLNKNSDSPKDLP